MTDHLYTQRLCMMRHYTTYSPMYNRHHTHTHTHTHSIIIIGGLIVFSMAVTIYRKVVNNNSSGISGCGACKAFLKSGCNCIKRLSELQEINGQPKVSLYPAIAI